MAPNMQACDLRQRSQQGPRPSARQLSSKWGAHPAAEHGAQHAGAQPHQRAQQGPRPSARQLSREVGPWGRATHQFQLYRRRSNMYSMTGIMSAQLAPTTRKASVSTCGAGGGPSVGLGRTGPCKHGGGRGLRSSLRDPPPPQVGGLGGVSTVQVPLKQRGAKGRWASSPLNFPVFTPPTLTNVPGPGSCCTGTRRCARPHPRGGVAGRCRRTAAGGRWHPEQHDTRGVPQQSRGCIPARTNMMPGPTACRACIMLNAGHSHARLAQCFVGRRRSAGQTPAWKAAGPPRAPPAPARG